MSAEEDNNFGMIHIRNVKHFPLNIRLMLRSQGILKLLVVEANLIKMDM